MDVDLFIKIYYETGSNGINQIELQRLEDTAQMERVLAYYNASTFVARRKMHADLSEFIELQKAEE